MGTSGALPAPFEPPSVFTASLGVWDEGRPPVGHSRVPAAAWVPPEQTDPSSPTLGVRTAGEGRATVS